MNTKINHTINPDKKYSFNEWMTKIIDAKENIAHLQHPVIRERARERWNERNKRYFGF